MFLSVNLVEYSIVCIYVNITLSLPGLFPLFGSAAMNVRSALLTVYETHFVPLGERLRPGLNGFLSGILSGLEEGSDHLERYGFQSYCLGDFCSYQNIQCFF